MRAGQLLVATPVLTDPSFARTVVLLLQADEADGALGLVLNRPSGTGVDEVLPGWAPLACSPPVVFGGGPVQLQAAVCLGHRRLGVPTTTAYAEVAGVPGGSIGTLDLDADPGDLVPVVDAVRLFAGYAGWSAGQLEAEVAEGAWWVVDALPADAFDGEPEQLWSRVLRRQGPPLAFAAGYPEDPTLN